MKKLNPVFLDRAQYSKMIDDIEDRHAKGQEMPTKTLHGKKCKITAIKKDNDFCYISQEDNRVVIVFQGSNDGLDWISNARFLQGFHGGVHGGMYHSAIKFREELSAIIATDPKAARVLCVGHSRGGALALFLSIFLMKYGVCEKVDLMTFGSPKVLGSEAREEFNKHNIHYDNVQNRRDYVCRLGTPLFKTVGYIKTLPIPFWWNFRFIKRHKGYYENIKRLTS